MYQINMDGPNKKNNIPFVMRFLDAFKVIGGNEFGLIDYELFKTALREGHMNEAKEVLGTINAENHVSNGNLDYEKLCLSIIKSRISLHESVENGKVMSSSHSINTRTFTKNKANPGTSNIINTRLESNSSSEKIFCKSLRGILFNLNGDQRSYRYQLEVLENTAVEIFVKAIANKENTTGLPIEILVFHDGKNKVFMTSSSVINDEGYCAVKFFLKKGKYILIPVLLKWDVMGKSNSFDSLNLESLIHVEEESDITMTPACESALKVVFDSIDLDGNGKLSESEFDFFIRHTAEESASGEWTTIEDNFQIENHQLTFKGFLELYQMVLKTDPADIMNMLQQMGMNESLELENAQPFKITVKAETAKFNITPLPVSSYSEVAEKVLRKVAVEQGSSRKVKNMNDLVLYTHELPHRVTLIVQNQSHSKVTLKLDCANSVNCASHRGNLVYSVEVPSRSNVVGHHLFPIEPTKDWNVNCVETLE